MNAKIGNFSKPTKFLNVKVHSIPINLYRTPLLPIRTAAGP